MNADFAKALVKAQTEMPGIKHDSKNPHFRSEFTSLDQLRAWALPVLNRNGIAVAQFPTQNDQGFPTLTTLLIHESGEVLEREMPLFLPKNDPQGQGSALTYACRYALSAALGISTDKDDDGQAGTDAAEKDEKEPAKPTGKAPAAKPPQEPPADENPFAGDPAQYKLTFGKYKGKTVGEIAVENRQYLGWLAHSEGGNKQAKAVAAQFLRDDDIPF